MKKAGKQDYYRVLGVSRTATGEEIRRAYRRLAKIHHPDGKGKSRSDEFVRIQEAYDSLSDPGRRRKYDRWGNPDATEELMARLQRLHEPLEHPFFRFAMLFHYKRMMDAGCAKCPDLTTCAAWRERMQVINCPKGRK